jgi:hypothetical protein
MTDNPETKVVLKQRVLLGSNQPEFLQRVATVYINGKEYRFRLRQKQKETLLIGCPILVLDSWWTSIQKSRFTMPLAFSP